MKIGFNMLLWTANVQQEHFALFTDLKQIGYDGVELYLGDPDTQQYKIIKQELDRVGLCAAAVTCPPPEANPASSDAGARAKGLAHMRWAIDATAALGGETLGGPFHSAYKVFTGKAPTADEVKWCAEVMRDAAEYADTAGVTLAAEPLNRFECYLLNTGEQARELVAMVDHPRFGYLYDTHHAHIEEKGIRETILAGKDAIKLIHISENDRGAPGTGLVDWDANFQAIKDIGYDGWLTIEAFSPDDPEFAGMIHVFREYDPKGVITRGGYAFIQKMLTT